MKQETIDRLTQIAGGTKITVKQEVNPKVRRAVLHFINRIEDAHKNAGSSNLVFGPTSLLIEKQKSGITEEDIAKNHRETLAFVKRLNEAHKNAGNSKLVFGPSKIN